MSGNDYQRMRVRVDPESHPKGSARHIRRIVQFEDGTFRVYFDDGDDLITAKPVSEGADGFGLPAAEPDHPGPGTIHPVRVRSWWDFGGTVVGANGERLY